MHVKSNFRTDSFWCHSQNTQQVRVNRQPHSYSSRRHTELGTGGNSQHMRNYIIIVKMRYVGKGDYSYMHAEAQETEYRGEQHLNNILFIVTLQLYCLLHHDQLYSTICLGTGDYIGIGRSREDKLKVHSYTYVYVCNGMKNN